MTRAISEEEFVRSKTDLLEAVGQPTILIEKDGKPVAALVSIAEYETTREAKAERAIEAMHDLGKHMRSVASPEELDDLEKELHARAR
jgi:prevent-host-death family protein